MQHEGIGKMTLIRTWGTVVVRMAVALAIAIPTQLIPTAGRPVLADCDTMFRGVGVPADARGLTFTGTIGQMTVQPYETSYTFVVDGAYAGAVMPETTIAAGGCNGIGGLALDGRYLFSTQDPDNASSYNTLVWRLGGRDGRDATLVDIGQPLDTYPAAVRKMTRLGEALDLVAPGAQRHEPTFPDRTRMSPIEVTASSDGNDCFGGRDCVQLIEIDAGRYGAGHFGAQVLPVPGGSRDATITNGLPAALPAGDYVVSGTAWSTPIGGPLSMSGTQVHCEARMDVGQPQLTELIQVSFTGDDCAIDLGQRTVPPRDLIRETNTVVIGRAVGLPQTVRVTAAEGMVVGVREAGPVELARHQDSYDDGWGEIIQGDDHLLVTWSGRWRDPETSIDLSGRVVTVTRTEAHECPDVGVVRGVVIATREPLPQDIEVVAAP